MDIKLIALCVLGVLVCSIGYSEACGAQAARELQSCSTDFISDIAGLDVKDKASCNTAVAAVDSFTSCLGNARKNNPDCGSQIKQIEDAIKSQREAIGDTCGTASISVSIFGLIALMLIHYALK